MISREIHLKSRPTGLPTADNFAIVEREISEPGAGEIIIQNHFMSVDTYMRGRMAQAWPTGEVMIGGAVGKVTASNNPAFAVGDYVTHGLGWREYAVTNGEGVAKIDPDLAPLSSYLGVMGMPGLTAYGGLLVTGEYTPGEAVFVSAASGAVGSIVGQIAKIHGSNVIGSAGSDDKVSMLMGEFGFNHAFNYKTANPLEELRKAAPKGIDIYFENVGGPQLEAALTHMRPYGRIPICGMISTYNDGATQTPGPRNLTETIYKHLTLKGFVVSAFFDKQPKFLEDMSGWIKSGEVKYHETIFDGIDNAVSAFEGLFQGANNGKMLVKLVSESI
jgi:NADPH-dependent curcumin reductase CurA